MKHYLIALAMMFALGGNAAGIKPQHRHHPTTTAADTTAQNGIEAYSDTTSADLAGAKDTVYTSNVCDDEFDIDSPAEEFIKQLLGGTIGAGAVIIAILVILAILLCALAPFIIVIAIIHYLIKQHNNRVTLAQKAMETGQPIPEDLKPDSPESPDYYKKKGIKNIAIGIGLAMMFSTWHAQMLAGVGLLIACWGVGQLVIAKTTK